jgi:uncharacterized protein (DUF1499 family)
MMVLKWLLIGVIALALLVLLAGQLGWLAGRAPHNLGLRDGKLKPPAKTPNSVSSQADLWPGHPQAAYARIAPLALAGGGPATMARLKAIILATPGATLVTAADDYLQVTFSTRLMKFTDDAEFWLDPAGGGVHVRSAARLGRRDFGVNRARIEGLRAQLAGAAPPQGN